MGRALVMLGKIDEAKLRFARALELDSEAGNSNDVAYFMALGGIDLPKARSLAESALADQTKDLCKGPVVNGTPGCVKRLELLRLSLDTLGFILFEQGQLAKAESYLVAAHQLRSASAPAEHLGLLRLKQNKIEEAVRLYVEAERARLPLDTPPHALRRELEKVVSAEELNRQVKEMPAAGLRTYLIPGKFTWPKGETLSAYTKLSLRAMVDESGAIDPSPGGLTLVSVSGAFASAAIADAKGFQLEPISWPGHALKTARVIEFGYSPNGSIKAWWTVAK